MEKRSERVVEMGYEYANNAIEFLKKAIPETERHPLDMAAFSGSAAAALLATAYKNVIKITKDAQEARIWLASNLEAAATHISEDSGYEVKILVVEKNSDR